MSLKIPEDAPFTGPQRYWLRGFLDGINNALVPADGSPGDEKNATEVEAGSKEPVTIAWGSQTGNAEGLAKKLSKKLSKAGFIPTVADMLELTATDVTAIENLLVITSTYGEGEPPDNATALYSSLHAEDAPDLAATRYSVLALGDSSYENFCKCGFDFDQRLDALGATSLAPIVTCDGDYEEPFEIWSGHLLEAFAAT